MAHFRESNAVFLEVLEPPIAEGVPIELDIFDGASPATLLATLEGAKDIALQQELNKPGSASFRINRHDPKATSAVVDRENLAKLKVGGKYRFAFWMRERKIEVLQEGEEEQEYWSIGGPGALQYVDRGEMWTVSYLGDNPIGGVWDLGNAFGGNSVGQMARRVIDEQLAKTPSPMGLLTTNWTYDVDSQGNAWSDSADLEVNVGDNVLDVLGLLTGLGLDIRMRHDLLLEAFVELGRHYDVASAPELPVVFRGGQNVTTSLSRRSQGGIASRALVKGAGDAVVEVVRPDIEADPYVGRREIFLSVSNAKDATTMQRAGEAELSGRLADTEAISFGVAHGTGPGEYEPWVHYDIGDWITLDEPGVYDLASYRIVGWSIKQVEDDYEVFLDCNSVEYEDLLKLARKAGLDSAGGSTGGSSTSQGGGGGGSTSSSSKVAAELGDSAGYLYDKLAAGSGIVKSLAGVAGSRTVSIALAALGLDALSDVDTTTTPPTDGQTLVYDLASSLWKPGAASGGGAGSALPAPDYSESNAAISASTSQAILTRTILGLAAGRYLLLGKAWIWSSGVGTLRLRANGVQVGGDDDPRNDVAQRILFGYYDHPGGDVTFDIYHAQESGTTVYGTGGDPRFGRELLVVPLASTSAVGPATGPAFPGAPAVGSTFYRSDLDLHFVYDGTRWKTVQEYSISWIRRGGDMPWTASTTFGHAPLTGRVYLERMISSAYVTAAGTATDYWNLQLAKNTPANAQTIVATQDTKLAVANNWLRQVTELDVEADAATHAAWYGMATKVGNPGSLYLGFEVLYRRVET